MLIRAHAMLTQIPASIGQYIPHGYCLSWQPGLLLINIGADLLTAAAYGTIPLALLYFVRRRQDLQFPWIFILFGVFILACGATHLMSVWTLWFPDYVADALLKAFTALVSISCAVSLWKLLPKAIALPGPAAWARAHAEMRAQMAAQEISTSVFDTAMNGIAVVDERAQILVINPAFMQMTGYSASEAVGKPLMILNGTMRGAGLTPEIWDCIIRSGNWSGQVCCKTNHGETFHLSLTISRVASTGDTPQRYVCIFADVTDQQHHLQQLSYRASHDALTGLANRALLLEQLELSLASRAQTTAKVGLMFIDLDDFKPINDRCGHDVGDTVLRVVSERLSHQIRPGDTAARIGGDEFVLLLRNMDDANELRSATERLLESLRKPIEAGTFHLTVGASVGLACAPDDGDSPEALMQHADQAMYAAKHHSVARSWQSRSTNVPSPS